MLGSNYQRLTKKCSILEMQRMLLWMRGKLVKFQKISVTNINFKGGITTTTSHIPPMTFQTAEVMQKDGNKVKLSCVLTDSFSEGNCLAEVEEGDLKGTFVCEDDAHAHKAAVCT